MGVEIVAHVNCDLCKTEVKEDEKFINAMTYGVVAHECCFRELTPYQVLRFLGLDEITIGWLRDFDAQKRWWVSDLFNKVVHLTAAKLPKEINA